MIHIEQLMNKLQLFVHDHGITDDLTTRWAKLQVEVDELDHAIMEMDRPEIIKECCDVILVSLHIMRIAGAVNPLWHCYNKLEEVAARPKYQEIARRVKEKSSQLNNIHLQGNNFAGIVEKNTTATE